MSQIVMRLCAIWIGAKSFAELVDCFVNLSCRQQTDGQVVVRDGVIGFHPKIGLIGGNRLSEVAFREKSVAESVMRSCKIRLEFQGLLRITDGFAHSPFF